MNKRSLLDRLLLDPAGEERDPFSGEQGRRQAGVMGMWLLIVTLGILFVAAILAFLVVRLDLHSRGEAFVPFGSPDLPKMLLASTAMLIACGVALHKAVACAREAALPAHVSKWMQRALVCGVAFLAFQCVAWWQMATAMSPGANGLAAIVDAMTANLYGWTFFMMTGLHAAHVIGGLIPMTIAAKRARAGWYSAGSERGLVLLAMYWHFLDAAWVVLYLSLWLATL